MVATAGRVKMVDEVVTGVRTSVDVVVVVVVNNKDNSRRIACARIR